MKRKAADIIYLILNVIVLFFLFISIILELTKSPQTFFNYYTNIGALLAFGMSITNIIYTLWKFQHLKYSKLIKLLNIITNTLVLLSFLTFLFVLLPIYKGEVINSFECVSLRLIIPVLLIVSMFFDTNVVKFKPFVTVFTVIPMLIYGSIILMVVALDNMTAPYPFLDFKTNVPSITVLSLFGMILLNLLVGYSLMYLSSRVTYFKD